MSNYRPTSEQYYRHQDGGLYWVRQIAKSTVDQSEHVVYDHVFPFEKATWIRPLDEWTTERFKLIEGLDVLIALSQDPEQAKIAITEHKAQRRAAQQ